MAKPRVLAACPPFALPALERVLGSYMEFVAVHFLAAAQEALEDACPELVLCGVHFDESHMFDLLAYSRQRFPGLAFICVRILDSEIPRISREAIGIAARSLGAAAFIDFPELCGRLGNDEAERQMRSVVLAHLPRRPAGRGMRGVR